MCGASEQGGSSDCRPGRQAWVLRALSTPLLVNVSCVLPGRPCFDGLVGSSICLDGVILLEQSACLNLVSKVLLWCSIRRCLASEEPAVQLVEAPCQLCSLVLRLTRLLEDKLYYLALS